MSECPLDDEDPTGDDFANSLVALSVALGRVPPVEQSNLPFSRKDPERRHKAVVDANRQRRQRQRSKVADPAAETEIAKPNEARMAALSIALARAVGTTCTPLRPTEQQLDEALGLLLTFDEPTPPDAAAADAVAADEMEAAGLAEEGHCPPLSADEEASVKRQRVLTHAAPTSSTPSTRALASVAEQPDAASQALEDSLGGSEGGEQTLRLLRGWGLAGLLRSSEGGRALVARADVRNAQRSSQAVPGRPAVPAPARDPQPGPRHVPTPAPANLEAPRAPSHVTKPPWPTPGTHGRGCAHARAHLHDPCWLGRSVVVGYSSQIWVFNEQSGKCERKTMGVPFLGYLKAYGPPDVGKTQRDGRVCVGASAASGCRHLVLFVAWQNPRTGQWINYSDAEEVYEWVDLTGSFDNYIRWDFAEEVEDRSLLTFDGEEPTHFAGLPLFVPVECAGCKRALEQPEIALGTCRTCGGCRSDKLCSTDAIARVRLSRRQAETSILIVIRMEAHAPGRREELERRAQRDDPRGYEEYVYGGTSESEASSGEAGGGKTAKPAMLRAPPRRLQPNPHARHPDPARTARVNAVRQEALDAMSEDPRLGSDAAGKDQAAIPKIRTAMSAEGVNLNASQRTKLAGGAATVQLEGGAFNHPHALGSNALLHEGHDRAGNPVSLNVDELKALRWGVNANIDALSGYKTMPIPHAHRSYEELGKREESVSEMVKRMLVRSKAANDHNATAAKSAGNEGTTQRVENMRANMAPGRYSLLGPDGRKSEEVARLLPAALPADAVQSPSDEDGAAFVLVDLRLAAGDAGCESLSAVTLSLTTLGDESRLTLIARNPESVAESHMRIKKGSESVPGYCLLTTPQRDEYRDTSLLPLPADVLIWNARGRSGDAPAYVKRYLRTHSMEQLKRLCEDELNTKCYNDLLAGRAASGDDAYDADTSDDEEETHAFGLAETGTGNKDAEDAVTCHAFFPPSKGGLGALDEGLHGLLLRAAPMLGIDVCHPTLIEHFSSSLDPRLAPAMWPYAEGKAQFVREVVSEAGLLTPPSDMDALDGAPGAGEAPHAQHLRAVGAALTAAAPLHASIGGKLAGVTRAQLEEMLLEANATRGLPHTQEGRQARQAAAFADGPVIRALASLDAAAARRAATDIARFVRARRKRGLASAHSNRMNNQNEIKLLPENSARWGAANLGGDDHTALLEYLQAPGNILGGALLKLRSHGYAVGAPGTVLAEAYNDGASKGHGSGTEQGIAKAAASAVQAGAIDPGAAISVKGTIEATQAFLGNQAHRPKAAIGAGLAPNCAAALRAIGEVHGGPTSEALLELIDCMLATEWPHFAAETPWCDVIHRRLLASAGATPKPFAIQRRHALSPWEVVRFDSVPARGPGWLAPVLFDLRAFCSGSGGRCPSTSSGTRSRRGGSRCTTRAAACSPR